MSPCVSLFLLGLPLHIYPLSLQCPVNSRNFLHSFLLFFFFLFLLDNIKWPIFEPTNSFLCSINSNIDINIDITDNITLKFFFVHCNLQFQNLFGSYFDFYIFLDHLVLFMYYSPNFIDVSICVLCSSLSFLKTIILTSLSGNL